MIVKYTQRSFGVRVNYRVRQVHCYVKTCIATGGGIVTQPQNWGKMHTGIVVWLDMEVRRAWTAKDDQLQGLHNILSCVVVAQSFGPKYQIFS